MSNDREFSLMQVINGLGMKRETYKEWIMRGFITASIQKQQGARTFNSYTAEDVLAVALFKHLIENTKLPREVAARMVRSMRDSGISLYLDGYIAIAQKDSVSKKPNLEVKVYNPNEVSSKDPKTSPDPHYQYLKVPRDFDTAYIINWRKILKRVRLEFKF